MEVFVARQPIFDRNGEFPNIDGDHSTADVIINSYLNIGLEISLVNPK